MSERNCLVDNRSGTPSVTVAIPTFNRPVELERCLSSVDGQTVPTSCYQVLVINNSQDETSRDNTREVIEKFAHLPIAYFENDKNIGMFGNWNACISECMTSHLTILNDDDQLSSEFLELMLPQINSEVLLVTRARIVGAQSSRLRDLAKWSYLRWLRFINLTRNGKEIGVAKFLSGNTIHASLGVIFNVAAARSIGGFDESKFPAADLVFSHTYALKFGVKYDYRELSSYHWGDNASLRLEIVKGQVLQEFRLRALYLKRYGVGSTLHKLGRFWSVVHLKSKISQINGSRREEIEIPRFGQVFEKVPRLNIRLVYFGWKVFQYATFLKIASEFGHRSEVQ